MSAPKTKTKYVSKGERGANRQLSKTVKRERTAAEKWTILQDAWLKGRNPWDTIPNPNAADTRARYIKVRAETEWGDPRKGFMFGGSKE